MAEVEFYIGSQGPFFFDDAEIYNTDGELVNAVRVTGTGSIRIDGTPVESYHAITKGWLEGSINVVPVTDWTDVGAPGTDVGGKLASLSANDVGFLLMAWKVVAGAPDEFVLYAWDTDAGAENVPYLVDGAGGGSWAAIAGKYVGTAFAHVHATTDITSGTLVHERGGLEADVSAFDGLVKISGGTTSAQAVGSGGGLDADTVDSIEASAFLQAVPDPIIPADGTQNITGNLTVSAAASIGTTLSLPTTVANTGINFTGTVASGQPAILWSADDGKIAVSGGSKVLYLQPNLTSPELRIGTGSTGMITNFVTGVVGILQPAPSYVLDVNGTARIVDAVTFNAAVNGSRHTIIFSNITGQTGGASGTTYIYLKLGEKATSLVRGFRPTRAGSIAGVSIEYDVVSNGDITAIALSGIVSGAEIFAEALSVTNATEKVDSFLYARNTHVFAAENQVTLRLSVTRTPGTAGNVTNISASMDFYYD